jgi:hypothetical protein
MANDPNAGLSTMLSFLQQGSNAGNDPLPQMPDYTSINMPAPQQQQHQGGNGFGGVLKGLLGNLTSQYLGYKLKSYTDKQDNEEFGAALNKGIESQMSTVGKDSAFYPILKNALSYPSNEIGNKNKHDSLNYINNALTSAATPTANYKDATNSVTAPTYQRHFKNIGASDGTERNADGSLSDIPYNHTPGSLIDYKAQIAQNQKASPPGANPEQLALSKDRNRIAQESLDARLHPPLKLGPGEEVDPYNQGSTRLRTNSPQWIVASQKHEKDWQQKEFINTKADIAQQKIKNILDPKNKSGFERNFGSNYSGYLTSQFPDAVVVRKELDDLKDSLKNAGLDMMKTGGSIGAMSVQEWPIVQGVLGSITPGMPEDEARTKLQEVNDRLEVIRNLGTNSYDTGWSNSQFYNPKTSKQIQREKEDALKNKDQPEQSGGTGQQGAKNVYNYGNLRPSKSSGGFQSYKTPEEGIAAIGNQLKIYGNRDGINTIAGIVNKWAPESDGNDVQAYIKSISQTTGLGLNDKIDLNDPAMVHMITAGIMRKESNKWKKSSQPTKQPAQVAQSDQQMPDQQTGPLQTKSKFTPTQFGTNKKNGRKYFINADGKPEYVP